MSPRRNLAALEADADEIVRRLLDGSATITGIMRDYHCGHAALMRIWRACTTPTQRRAVRRRNRGRSDHKGRFRKGHTTWNKGLKGIHLSPGTEFKPGVSPRRNLAALEADADEIVRRLLYTSATIAQLRREYRVGWQTLSRFYAARTPPEQRMEAGRRKARKSRQRPGPAPAPRTPRAAYDYKGVEAAKRELRGPVRVTFQCQGCGCGFDQQPAPPCPKCGGHAFERLELREAS